jgi:sec-independent protein translocase protein TatA
MVKCECRTYRIVRRLTKTGYRTFRQETWRTAAIALYLTNRSTGAATLEELKFSEEFMFEGFFQPMHLLVIFGIALLVFGPKKLPELGKGIGEGIRGFKLAMRE